MRVPACPMPIQNTKVVMYIAHIWGERLPAAPIPIQICQAHAATPAPRVSPITHIQAKYLSPGMLTVRMTSRLTSAQVGCVVVVLALVAAGVIAYTALNSSNSKSVQLRQDVKGQVNDAVDQLRGLIEDNTQ